MLLNSQIEKIEKIGLKINDRSTIGNYTYEVFTNMNNRSRIYFSVRVKDNKTNKWTTLCTRANIDTVFKKVIEHKNINS